MAVVETVAHLQSESKTKVLEERLSALQDRENELVRKDAEKNLREKHPDFDEIRNSDEFQEWAECNQRLLKIGFLITPDDATLAVEL